MKPLVLTGWLPMEYVDSGLADLALHFPFRFVWGQLPSADELAAYLGPAASDQDGGRHWSDFAFHWKQSDCWDPRIHPS